MEEIKTTWETSAVRDAVTVRQRPRRVKNISLYLLLLPSLVFLAVFNYAPLYGLIIAFKDYNSFLGIWSSPWVGMKHFVSFLTAPNFWTLIRNTLVISLYSLALGFPLPILLALFVNEIQRKWFKKTIQTVSYAPYFISTIVTVGMCFSILSVDSGVVNNIIRNLGGQPIYFMGEARYLPTIYVVSGLWTSMGWSSIIYVGTLSSVDMDLHEAAVLDGAGRLKRIWHINFPAIKPVVMISLLMNIGNIMGVGFEKIYLMQTAGNLETSEILATYVYRVTLAAKLPQYSFGTAVGIFNSVINVILLGLANFVSKRLGQESLW